MNSACDTCGPPHEVTECPSCRYLDPGGTGFSTCPRCGIIIAKYFSRKNMQQPDGAASDADAPDARVSTAKTRLMRPGNILKLLVVVAILLAVKNYVFTGTPIAGNTALTSADSSKLFVAVQNGNWDKVRQLLLLGHDPNVVVNGRTPLEIALYAENIDIAGLLLEKGAGLSFNRAGDKPSLLEECIGRNLTRSALFLLSQYPSLPDPTPRGVSLLNLAAENGNMTIVKELINRGKSVNTRDRSGRTALLEAARVTNAEMARFLIKSGADVNVHDTQFGYTALMWGAKNTEIIRMLIDAGAYVNARSANGCTPLHSAVGSLNLSGVKLLIEKGADVKAKDNRGVTPLKITTFHRNPSPDPFPEMAGLLRKAGAVE